MQPPIAPAVLQVEAGLRAAMLTSDVEALAQLLSRRLVFTDQAGQVYGKEDDLEAHRSGLLKLSTLEILETKILEVGGAAAVINARVRLAGTYGDSSVAGMFRYTVHEDLVPLRNWRLTGAGRPRQHLARAFQLVR